MTRALAARLAALASAALLVFLLPGLLPEGRVLGVLGPHAREQAAVERLEEEQHLDDVMPFRFAAFVVDALQGDFGPSYVRDVDPAREVARHAGFTVALVALLAFGTRLLAGRVAWMSAPRPGALVVPVLALEALWRWPGIGRVLSDAAALRDIAVVQAVVAVCALGWVLLAPVRGLPARARSASARLGAVAWAWLVIVPAIAAFAPRLPFADGGRVALGDRNAAVSWTHWLGADQFGRDVLARTVFGARESFLLDSAAALAGVFGGIALGMLFVFARDRFQRLSAVPRCIGALGVPAAGVAMSLALFGDRSPRHMVWWLGTAAVVPGVVLAITLAGSWHRGIVPGRAELLRRGGAAALSGAAAVAVVETVLGAIGIAPDARVTLGGMLGESAGRLPGAWLAAAAPLAVALLTAGAALAASRRLAFEARFAK